MAIALALFSSVLWGSADFEGGRLAKRFPSMAVTGVSQFFGLCFGVVFVIASGAWRLPAFGPDGYLISGFFAGIFGYLGLICLYAGLASGRMGVVSPISSLCAIIPLTYALISGERLSLLAGIGISVALLGAFCASGPEISQRLPLKPLLYALGALFGFGTSLTFMARGSASSALMTMVFMRVTTLFISLAVACKRKSIGGFRNLRDFRSLAFIGIADFSANVLIGMASTRGLVSVVMVLGSLFPIMTAILAFKILHERLHYIQYIGIFFAVLGVGIISVS
ncbi:MAG: DMT family transporter [Streptomycetaceae bacterium]|nr:MAG: DMT family transporter [Streptomycetaceae bacterium]